MLSLPANKPGLFTALICGAALGFGLLKALPLFNANPLFLVAIPFVFLFFLGIVLNVKSVVVILLLSRALLDPVLNMTKSDSNSAGLGAVLNIFVVLLTTVLFLRSVSAGAKHPLFLSWVGFLAFCAVGIFVSPFPLMAFKLFFNLLSYFAMALLPFLIDPGVNDKKFWLKVLLAASVFPVLFANLDMIRGGRAFEDAGSRITGTFTHPNILAFYLVLVVALIFNVLRSGHFRPSGWQKGVLLLYLGNVLVLLLATKTRNAWIACWLLFFIYGLVREKKFILITIVALLVGLWLPQVHSRTADLSGGGGGSRVNSFAWRYELWKSSMPSIKERPLFGHGLATFNEYSRGFFLMERRSGVDAHNTYVQILFEMGAAGLIAYVLMYARLLPLFLDRVRKARDGLSIEYAIAFSYVVTYVLSSIADNMFYYLALNWYFWFFVGAMLKGTQFHGYAIFRRNPVV